MNDLQKTKSPTKNKLQGKNQTYPNKPEHQKHNCINKTNNQNQPNLHKQPELQKHICINKAKDTCINKRHHQQN